MANEDKKTRLRDSFLQNRLFVVEILFLMLICIIHAISAGHYVDFYPINGTFQNFNPVRRLLAGQMPYRDFNDYLGMGHLFLGSVTTLLFGGNYKSSLIAFSFLTFFSFALLSLVIGKACLKDWKLSAVITNLILLMLLIQPVFFDNALAFTEEIKESLIYTLNTGNSARFIRGMILPLDILLIFLAEKIYCLNRNKIKEKYKRLVIAVGTGIISGFSFIWSNDYGISCWLCLTVIFIWMMISRRQKIKDALLYTLIEIITSFVSVFIIIEALTLGHFTRWFKMTLGTGGYQSWYYNTSKSYYIYDVDFSYIMLIQAFLALFYLMILYKKKADRNSFKRYGILGFANMTCFCAVNEYKLLSGGSSYEVALSVLFLTIVYEIFHMVQHKKKIIKICTILSLVVASSWLVSTLKDEIVFWVSDKEGKYVAGMGGYMTSLYDDLEETSAFLNGESFWATYASAQETVEGEFQPSGTDYIIHVLGDEQREEYLSKFQKGDFKYAVTIRKGFSDWEYWIERANWFFYRELYQNWHPVYQNAYEVYWEKNNIPGENTIVDNYDIEIIPLDESTVKLTFQTDESVNGIADVYIDYSVDKKKHSKKTCFLFSKMLLVKNTGEIHASGGFYYEMNYLRDKNNEYIPMPITDGYGELTLTACPSESVLLNLKEVNCERIYTIPYQTINDTSIE